MSANSFNKLKKLSEKLKIPFTGKFGARGTNKKTWDDMLRKLRAPVVHQIIPSIIILVVRFAASEVEIMQTYDKPVITYKNVKNEKLTDEKIRKIITDYVLKRPANSGHIRVIRSDEKYEEKDLLKNYKQLPKPLEYEIREIKPDQKLAESKMKKLILREANEPIIYSLGSAVWNTKANECTLDALIHQYQGTEKNKTMTRMSIRNDMGNPQDITVKHITDFCKKKHISLYIQGVCNELVYKDVQTKCMNIKPMFCKIANDHLYLIEDEKQKKSLRYGTQELKPMINWKESHITTARGSIDQIITKLVDLSKSKILGKVLDKVFIITDIMGYHNLNVLCDTIFARDNLIVENIGVEKNGNIMRATYKDIFILYKPDYEDILEIIKELNEILPIEFINQTKQEITNTILKHLNGVLPSSMLNDNVYKSLTKKIKGGINLNIGRISKNCITLDISKAHSSIVYNRRHDWGVFDVFDEWRPYERIIQGAKYMIKKDFLLGDIKMISNVYDSELVENCLKNGIIRETDITHQLIPAKTLPPNYFKNLIEIIYKVVPKHAKHLINLFIGAMGSHMSSYMNAELQNSDAFGSYYTSQYKKGTQFNCKKIKELSIFYKTITKSKTKHNLPIYQSVIDMSYWYLYELNKTIREVGECDIIQIHTDSITIRAEHIAIFRELVGVKLVDSGELPLGMIREDILDKEFFESEMEDWEIDREREKDMRINMKQEIRERNNNIQRLVSERNENKIKIEINEWAVHEKYMIPMLLSRDETFALFGKPGRGKTYSVSEIVQQIKKNDKRVSVCSLSHKAVENLRRNKIEAVVIQALITPKPQQSQLGKLHELARKFEYIIIDEYTIIGSEIMESFYVLHKLGVKLIFIGDYHQLPPVDKFRSINYRNSECFMEMCSFNYIELEKNYRFDERLDRLIEKVYDKGELRLSGINIQKNITDTRFNICHTHKTRNRINNKFSDINEKEHKKININNKWCVVGTPLISKVNEKQHNLFNNRMFILKSWDDKNITMTYEKEDFTITRLKAAEMADLYTPVIEMAHCITCHSAQGSTINENICIWDSKKDITREYLYTALSRTTSMDKVRMVSFEDKIKIKNIKKHKFSKIGEEDPYEIKMRKGFSEQVYGFLNKKDNELIHVSLDKCDKKFEEYCEKEEIKFKIKKLRIIKYDYDDELNEEFDMYVNSLVKYGENLYDKQSRRLREGEITQKEKETNEWVDAGDRIRYKYYENGKRKEKKIRYGKRNTYAEAINMIESFIEELKQKRIKKAKKL